MKKAFAIILTLALLIAALAIPATAEEAAAQTNTQITAMGGRNRNGQMPGRGGRQNGQMPGNGQQNGQLPQMPGNGQRNGQMPGNGRQNGQQPQMPQMPDSSAQRPAAPAADSGEQPATGTDMAPGTDSNTGATQAQQPFGGRPGKPGSQMPFGRGRVSFEDLLKAGVIDQTTYDAIIAYMKEHAPAAPTGTAPSGEQAPADGSDAQTPEQPADNSEGNPPELPASGAAGDTLLEDLLAAGIITQEQYDVMTASQSADLTGQLRIESAVND